MNRPLNGTANEALIGVHERFGIPGAAGRGGLAGLIGGLTFGPALDRFDLFPAVAQLVGSQMDTVGFAVHLVIAGLLGAGFGVLIRRQRAGVGQTVFWGLAYGMFWWYLGPLTLLPLLSGLPAGWNIPSAQAAFPWLIGHLLYGASMAFALAGLDLLSRPATRPSRPRGTANGTARRGLPTVVRGLIAGLAATWLLTSTIAGSGAILTAGDGTWLGCLLGALVGVGYALLFPTAAQATGPASVQGAGYGFLLWVTVPLTAVPLLRDGRLLWSADDVHEVFATLPEYVLLGSFAAGVYTGLARFSRLLLAAPAERVDEEGAGARTLRAASRGATAGVIGGLLFTVIMVQIGYLSTVAGLVGSSVTGVGLAVHLVVSVILGASYGLLFRRQSYDPVSGIGWGVTYGFLWWVLGALTILPIALGGSPQWSAQNAAAAFPSLIGHLGYGAGLGVVFHWLEARHDPWWIQHATAASRRASAARHRTALQSSAPAVWALVVPMAVTVTVVLGG
ncbi:MAG TPA: hypothetical protein VLL08_33495 [Kineosporiaceae bacterium]|nr:hypothetical protein [Kineosporiaceae bacterium]